MKKQSRKNWVLIIIIVFVLTLIAFPVLFSPSDTPEATEIPNIEPPVGN